MLIFRYPRPFHFKGEVRRGMGCLTAEKPIPTPTLPLKGRELECHSGRSALLEKFCNLSKGFNVFIIRFYLI
jgi:hypothetical protein